MSNSDRFIIFSQPRTGSNNASYCLNCHPDLIVGNELLQPENGVKITEFYTTKIVRKEKMYRNSQQLHWISQCDDDSFLMLIDELLKDKNSFKIHTSHISYENIELLAQLNMKIILTIRRDKFRQALSNYVAMIRDSWHANDLLKNKNRSYEPKEINRGHFVQWIDGMYRDLIFIKDVFEKYNTNFYVCEYETFFDGTLEVKVERVNKILDFLEVKRFGQINDEQKFDAFSGLKSFLNTDVQKVTKKGDIDNLITNRYKLMASYEAWKSKILP